MEKIIFQKPVIELKEQALSFVAELFQLNEYEIHGGAMIDKLSYEEWIDYIQKNEDKFNVFFVVRIEDNRIIGIVDIRLDLYNDFLKNYAGHIGYSIRPTERRRGFATMTLKKAVEYLNNLGENNIMVSCFSDNEPSEKTILKCGGKLSREVEYDGKILKIFYIKK